LHATTLSREEAQRLAQEIDEVHKLSDKLKNDFPGSNK